MIERPVLVTGASGNVGREVVRALARRGVVVRVGERQPGPRAHAEPAAETVRFDFHDARTFAGAVEGSDGVFLLRPPAIADVKRTLNRLVDVARERGAGRIVFLSVTGADRNVFVPHHEVEAHLARGPRDWTVLRPGFFAQNLGDAYLRDIVEDDRLYVPAGSGRAAFVDVRDVAEVAARVLTDARGDAAAHATAAYTLTGPSAIGFAEAAAELTEALGREIRYSPASIIGYARHLRRRGMPSAQVAVQTVLHVGLRFGQAARVDPTLPSLLGRGATPLRTYIRDHAAAWRKAR